MPDATMEPVRCNLCRANRSRLLYPSTIADGPGSAGMLAYRCTHSGYGRHHAIVKCTDCGLVYANPRLPATAVLDSYAAVEDPLYVEERGGRVLTFGRHLRPLEKLKRPPGRLLDVGAYTGVFVEVARDRGWDAWGLEPSHWAVQEARKRGLQMIEGTFDSVRLPDVSYDVITMWDVIEHLSDPMSAVEETWRLLKPGGIVIAHTMDIDSRFARLLGSRWPWLMQMHLYYFSRRTLSEMLRKAGFEVLDTVAQGRFVRLSYLADRLGGLLGESAGPRLAAASHALGLGGLAVPVNLGDLFTAFGRKPPIS